jgi:hypothetical protein
MVIVDVMVVEGLEVVTVCSHLPPENPDGQSQYTSKPAPEPEASLPEPEPSTIQEPPFKHGHVCVMLLVVVLVTLVVDSKVVVDVVVFNIVAVDEVEDAVDLVVVDGTVVVTVCSHLLPVNPDVQTQ